MLLSDKLRKLDLDKDQKYLVHVQWLGDANVARYYTVVYLLTLGEWICEPLHEMDKFGNVEWKPARKVDITWYDAIYVEKLTMVAQEEDF